MDNNSRKLRYLPIFYDDLNQALNYIGNRLKNPQAAFKLLDDVESAILARLPIADSFEPYPSIKERQHKYYRIYVGNYVVYYVLLKEGVDSVMEVRRFLYKGRNRAEIV